MRSVAEGPEAPQNKEHQGLRTLSRPLQYGPDSVGDTKVEDRLGLRLRSELAVQQDIFYAGAGPHTRRLVRKECQD